MNEPMKEHSSKVERAEDALSGGIAKFETAMEHLAEKVEEGTHRLQHIVELGRKQKDELLRLKSKSQDVIEPLRGYVRKAQSNPRPYVLTAIGIAFGALAIGYFMRKSGGTPYSPELTPERPEKSRTTDSTGGYYEGYDENEYAG